LRHREVRFGLKTTPVLMVLMSCYRKKGLHSPSLYQSKVTKMIINNVMISNGRQQHQDGIAKRVVEN